MRTRRINALLIASMASQLAGYGLMAMGVKDVWYRFNALTHVLLWAVLLYIAYSTFNHRILNAGKWTKNLAMYGVGLALNQFLDEFIGDPTKFQWSEILIPSFIIIHLLLQWRYGRTK